jgi:predicted CopG family antitoxin
MARTARIRKEKKTYSLSPESVAFIGVVAEQIQLSASEVLDRLIQEKKNEAEREQISARISRYYDSLSDEEVKESALWGKFSESQFPRE